MANDLILTALLLSSQLSTSTPTTPSPPSSSTTNNRYLHNSNGQKQQQWDQYGTQTHHLTLPNDNNDILAMMVPQIIDDMPPNHHTTVPQQITTPFDTGDDCSATADYNDYEISFDFTYPGFNSSLHHPTPPPSTPLNQLYPFVSTTKQNKWSNSFYLFIDVMGSFYSWIVIYVYI
ncbi:hypothetical protein BC941DRAFT_203068 [Chlamydoabsidia padenii]|nr:hypothetical protein BC941DRAFT_203068 [Chlamydoabsidia padenii]